MADVCLIQMPYSTLYTPSLALGILKSCLIQNGFSCRVFYGDIAFADAIGYETYEKLLNKRIIYQFAEMSFAKTVWHSEETNLLTGLCEENCQQTYLEKIVYPLEGKSNAEEYAGIMAEAQKVIPDYLKNLAADILK
ncbi:MAG: hypothetical protein K2H31_05895, partial [Lachnospiraceae bacterium]|nr:hypothetical protein [Lachnospiraceae bacterium]